MNEQEFADLAAGAALHALSPHDEERFRSALAAHPEWRTIAEEDAATVSALADGVRPVSPPNSIRASLLDHVARTPQDGATHGGATSTAQDQGARGAAWPESLEHAADDAPPPRVRRWSRSMLALAACLALLVGVGIGTAVLNAQLNRPAAVVALEEITSADDAAQASVELDSGGKATAHWSESLGSAVLVTDDIPALTEGKTYEMWFVRDGVAISAGVFAADEGEATAALKGDLRSGDIIAVTVEQAGGSPNGQPTSDPVIVIPTA